MSKPDQEERIAIQKFRERVQDVIKTEEMNSDMFLIRWLRARELSLDKAESMLRASLKWRLENHVDLTLSQPVDPYFLKHYPFEITGRDREGRPVLVLPLGKWDVRMAVDDGRVDQLVHYINYFFEKIMEAIKKDPGKDPSHPNTQFTSIVDWDGYSFRQFTNIKAAQSILKMSSTYEAHYPEVLHASFFINCTSVFQMVFALMKKVLAERTIGKIKVFGTNRKDWEPQIYKMIDPKEIKYELKSGQPVTD